VPVKVLLSAFQCSPGRGSEPGNGWHWATALARFGHDVTVLTVSGFREPILAADTHGIEFCFIDLPDSPLERLASRWAEYDVYRRWQDAALAHVAAQADQYDVVHHVTWASLRLGSTLWQLTVPLVYGPIGGGQAAPGKYWRYFGRNWPAEALRGASGGRLLLLNGRSRRTIRNAAVTLAVNSATAAACRRLGGTDVRHMLADAVPPDWIATARQRPDGTPVVLWVGRLESHKAPALAVEAFAELRQSMPARLVIAGDGPLREQVRVLVERLGLADDVDMLGQVPFAELRRLYDSASVFMFTSLRETFGSPFLEALGRGLPAVALDHHGIGDVEVGPAAVKVALASRPRELPGHLATALRTVLADPDWAARSEAAIDWASEQVWSARAAAATQIYEELVKRAG
jgi:glycosyltransferase involved in cell wall biosynthesis